MFSLSYFSIKIEFSLEKKKLNPWDQDIVPASRGNWVFRTTFPRRSSLGPKVAVTLGDLRRL